MSPGGGDWAALGEVWRQRRIEEREPRRKHSAVGFDEEDGNAPSERSELVAVRTGSREIIALRRSRGRS